jgi:hypothetical protein
VAVCPTCGISSLLCSPVGCVQIEFARVCDGCNNARLSRGLILCCVALRDSITLVLQVHITIRLGKTENKGTSSCAEESLIGQSSG